MKSFVFLCFALLAASASNLPANAGFRETASGEVFEEPAGGYVKLINTGDGLTYFFVLRKGKITLQQFGADHKPQAKNELVTSDEDIMKGEVLDVFPTGNQLAVFISDIDGRVPALYRILIDRHTLAITSEDKIAEMPKIKMKVFIGSAPKGFDMTVPYFRVAKDDESDSYVVSAFNTRAENPAERLEVSYFNAGHELLAKAFCNIEGQAALKVKSACMDIESDKKVTILALTDRSMAFWGSLEPGQNTFHFEKLDFTGAVGLTDAIVRFIPASGDYLILGVRKIGPDADPKYTSFLSRLNPATKAVSSIPVNPAKINQIAQTQYKRNARFNGLPQDLFIYNDGSYTIIYEEADSREQRSAGMNGKGMVSTHTWNKYFLKDVGITTYDKDGNELEAFYIPKSHQVSGMQPPFHYSRRRHAAVSLSMGFQYKQFFYFKSPQGAHLLFNDYEENQEKVEQHDAVKEVLSLNECLAYGFDLQQVGGVPHRTELWPHQGKKDGYLALFAASTYDEKNNTLTTLKLNYRSKDMQIVWLSPEE